ncbi:MAG: helix-turn-helix domain-containing protein, partial [Patescibacteria group bacterium]
MQVGILKKIGFSDKTAQIYMALLSLGPSSVRSLAEFCGLNRGTTYDALKWLQEQGVVSFYQKESKQQFVAEHPEKLQELVAKEEADLHDAERELGRVLPELEALYNKGGERPVAKYFEKDEISQILQDVLDTCEATEEKLYRIYSSAALREYLYDGFSTFSDVRVAKGIAVKAIAIGDGGELRGLDERKWLKARVGSPTYILLYPGKTAYISLNTKQEPIGVVIENDGVFETQKAIFDTL